MSILSTLPRQKKTYRTLKSAITLTKRCSDCSQCPPSIVVNAWDSSEY